MAAASHHMTKYGDPECVQKVWETAKPIKGKDPKEFRRDAAGVVIRWSLYGKQVPGGWQIDHIKSKEQGGSDFLKNLQALNWEYNQKKGGSAVKVSRHSKSNK